MKRRNESDIGSLVREFLRSQGLETPLNEYRLLASWGEVMGNTVARRTGTLRINNEVLWVEIKSAALRADLMMRRTELVRRLNDHVGFHVIHDIHFV